MNFNVHFGCNLDFCFLFSFLSQCVAPGVKFCLKSAGEGQPFAHIYLAILFGGCDGFVHFYLTILFGG